MKLNKYKRTRQIVAYGVVALNMLLNDSEKSRFTYEQFADKVLELIQNNSPRDVIERATNLIDFEKIDPYHFIQKKYAVAYSVVALYTLKEGDTKYTFTYELFAKTIDDITKINSPHVATKRAKKCLTKEFVLEVYKK